MISNRKFAMAISAMAVMLITTYIMDSGQSWSAVKTVTQGIYGKQKPLTKQDIHNIYESRKTLKNLMSRPDVQRMNLLTRALIFVMNLAQCERRVFSQNNEDGVLEAIFDHIGVETKYYVEFGVESGVECNTRIFREIYGWKGLLMDGGNENLKFNLHKEFIYPSNIIQLFKKYKVPLKFDLLSVDTDFKDFWILRNILRAGYRPRVIVGEINTYHGPTASITVPLDSEQDRWDGVTQYFGYSVTAGWLLGRYYGYSMVYCDSRGVNCMWVIDGAEGFGEGVQLSKYLNGSSLWKNPCCIGHSSDWNSRKYAAVTNTVIQA